MGVWSGSVRIDVAVINGELNGYELKSDRDTLERLPLQADIYSRVFDRLELVVGQRHATKAEAMIPKWWGVTVARYDAPSVRLEQYRPSQLNPTPDPYLIAQLLWKEEVLTLLDQLGLAHGWRGKRVKALHLRLAEQIPLPELRRIVRETLKKRTDWLR